MSATERAKGARGEREVVAMLRRYGFPCHRVPNSGGLHIPGDVTGVEGFHLEVKRQERLQLWQWLEQARTDAPAGATPVVIFRRNGDGWNACLPIEDLLYLIRKAGEAS